MVKKIMVLLAVLFGAGIGADAQVTITDSFLVDGRYRSYRLYVPAGDTFSARPLIINMHGLGSNAFQQQFYSGLMPIADTAGFLLVMPQGNKARRAYWSVGFEGMTVVDDVRFLSALIDTISARYPVDAGRVYATGMSNGGYMAYMLALKLSHRIAAVASVTGSIVPGEVPRRGPAMAVPVLQIHGTADASVPYGGSDYGLPIDSLMQFWVRRNGCKPEPEMRALPDTNSTDGSTVEHYVWSGGKDGVRVELFKVKGGGHTWPGAPISIGVTNRDFSAAQEIWRFFRRYRLGESAN